MRQAIERNSGLTATRAIGARTRGVSDYTDLSLELGGLEPHPECDSEELWIGLMP